MAPSSKSKIFKIKKESIAFFFHPSLSSSLKKGLNESIQKHGGNVVQSARRAKIVLIDEENIDGKKVWDIQLFYSIQREPEFAGIVVKHHNFVNVCIRAGVFFLEAQKTQGMAGATNRKHFTQEEDDNLAWYISRVIPDPRSGGRLGIAIYNKLVDALPWAKNHPAQSWRQHYKNNQAIFDKAIKDLAKHYPPVQEVAYSRTRLNSRRTVDEDEDSEDEDTKEDSEKSTTESEDDGPVITPCPVRKSKQTPCKRYFRSGPKFQGPVTKINIHPRVDKDYVVAEKTDSSEYPTPHNSSHTPAYSLYRRSHDEDDDPPVTFKRMSKRPVILTPSPVKLVQSTPTTRCGRKRRHSFSLGAEGDDDEPCSSQNKRPLQRRRLSAPTSRKAADSDDEGPARRTRSRTSRRSFV